MFIFKFRINLGCVVNKFMTTKAYTHKICLSQVFLTSFAVLTENDKENKYKESSWQPTSKHSWFIIDDLPNTLHEFRTVGKNDVGSSLPSDIAEERPLTGIGMYRCLNIKNHEV